MEASTLNPPEACQVSMSLVTWRSSRPRPTSGGCPVEVTEHAVAYGVLKPVTVGGREMGDLDRALGILAEHAVDDTDMEVEVSVQR